MSNEKKKAGISHELDLDKYLKQMKNFDWKNHGLKSKNKDFLAD